MVVWRRLRRCAPEPRGRWFEPLEQRILLTGFVGPGDVNPNEIRIGDAIVVDVDQSSFTTIARASRRVEIAKHDADGSLLWSHTIKTGVALVGGEYPLALAGDGGVIVAGAFTGMVDLDPGPGVQSVTSVRGRKAMFVARYDADGELVWASAVTGKGAIAPRSVAARDGKVLIAAMFNGAIDFDPGVGDAGVKSAGSYDMALVRFDADGVWQGAQIFGGRGDDRAYAVELDSLGRTWLAGRFARSLDADPGAGVVTLTSAGSNDGLLVRLDAGGALDWAGRIGGRGDDAVYHLAVAPDDTLYISGYFSSTADIDPTAAVLSVRSAGGRDMVLAALDSDAALLWAGALPARGDSWAAPIAATADGGLLVTGQYTKGIDLDPTAATLNIAAGSYGIFTLRLDRLGSPQWARWIGGGRFENSCSVAAVPFGNAYTLGNTISRRTDYDPGPATLYLPDDGVFLSRLDDDGHVRDAFLL